MEEAIKSVLTKAVIKILRPLVRVLISREVSHAEFVELARRVYVDVAYEYFPIPKKKTTYSRVAVLTGLSRKEVVRLVRDEDCVAGRKVTPNRAMRVVNGWLNDPEFLDEDREPKVLPLQGDIGGFSALVARYSGDITLGAVADELERTGVIFRPDQQSVKLNSYGYIPQADDLQKIEILSICASDLLNSTVYNLEHGQQDARFQRQVVYSQVPKETVENFRKYSNKKSLALLSDYNRWLGNDKTSASSEAAESTCRVGVGIYYFEDKNKGGD